MVQTLKQLEPLAKARATRGTKKHVLVEVVKRYMDQHYVPVDI